MRHPTKEAMDKFNAIFDIKPDPYSQDWEIEYSDPARLDEYIECYNKQTENDDERFTLMALILGAFEEYHSNEPPDGETWNKIKAILERDYAIHKDLIDYYQCNDSDDDDFCFPITYLMRQVVRKN